MREMRAGRLVEPGLMKVGGGEGGREGVALKFGTAGFKSRHQRNEKDVFGDFTKPS